MRILSSIITMATISVLVTTANETACTCDTAQLEGMGNRITAVEDLAAGFQHTTAKLKQDVNKMKKLTVASLNVALTAEEDQCHKTEQLMKLIEGLSVYVGLGPSSCQLMGSALYPASSCGQLHEACQLPSGTYFIQSVVYTEVYCEMEMHGGGWTRFGRGATESAWNFVDEDQREVTLTILDPREVKLIRDLRFSSFHVSTDVTFRMQGDDSTNPSVLEMRSLPWLEEQRLTIGPAGDHTRLELTDEGDRLNCIAGGTSRCGHYGLPRTDELSGRVAFTSVYFAPRAVHRGATAHQSQWERNRYTWSGSFYYLLAK